MAKALKIVRLKKENLFTQIQLLYDMTTHLADESIRKKFLIQAKSANRLRSDFAEALDLYHEAELEQDETYDPSYAPLTSINEMCDYINAALAKIEEKLLAKQESDKTDSLNVQARPRLPKIEIPDFDGTPEKWPVFYQLFSKLIHGNKSLSDLEKINYLVMHLQGSAKSICIGVLPTAENYKTLFDSLVKRYDDKRQLASAYLSKVLEFKPIAYESEKSINLFLEHFVESVVALKQLQIPDLLNFIFIHIALKKLDSETSRLFEMSYRKEEMPTFDQLVEFLREQAKILGRTKKPIISTPPKPSPTSLPKKTQSFIAQNPVENVSKPNKFVRKQNQNACVLCQKAFHQLYFCPEFHNKSVEDRWTIVQRYSACYNCLSLNSHKSSECQSKKSCTTCSRKHHTLLHRETKSSLSAITTTDDQSNLKLVPDASRLANPIVPKVELITSAQASNASQTLCSSSIISGKQSSVVLLATAQIKAYDSDGNAHVLRALIDNGSQSHLITPECCKRLGLEETAYTSTIKGLGSSTIRPKAYTTFTFCAHMDPDSSYTISALVTAFLQDAIPSTPVRLDNLSHLRSLPLADPCFQEPGKIDLLIGAALWPYLIRNRRVYGPPGTPAALQTTLGYIVMGELLTERDDVERKSFCAITEGPRLDKLLQRFWSLEDIPNSKEMNADEKKCEEFFLETCKRDLNGKFAVALPFKQDPSKLGSSKEICKAKYIAQEKRLLQRPDVHLLYSSVMQDNLEKNYMSWVSDLKDADSDAHFLPHHGVIRPESTSTPLRVVFNASSPTSNGTTLNSLLQVGPKLYPEIFDLLLNFRLFPFAVSADVSKMYLQIGVHPEFRKYQRLIWRPSPEVELQIYELNTVVFGFSCSPYLAQRVIRLLAELEKSRYPITPEIVNRDIYMDDLVTSTKDERSAIEIYQQLKDLFLSGGFTLTKWCSNSPELMAKIPEKLKLTKNIELNKETSTKVLGIQWSPEKDVLLFKIAPHEGPCTKRTILSVVARTFDLLGLLSPVLITAKIIIQELWQLNVDWDEAPPDHVAKQWESYTKELPMLKNIEFPRHTYITPGIKTSLIGFADASGKAYGACVYVRTENAQQEVKVVLLCAKSKVAPLKLKSIPRLELCAALLLSRLMKHIVDLYQERHVFDQVVAFSDSTVTLHWIKSNPNRWKVFVSNRILQIQENLEPSHWRYVSGKENPSDCLSRGVTPKALLNHPLWFQGPPWLKKGEEEWPSCALIESNQEEIKNEAKLVMTITTEEQEAFILEPLLERVSSFKKLIRSTALVQRFIQRKPVKNFPITAQDMDKAELLWIKAIQNRYLKDSVVNIKCNKPCSKNIRHLDPFLEDGLLRVGGRLQYSDLPHNKRHPILLPKNNRFVDLLIDHYHQENLHTGAHMVISLLNLKYWIISVRAQVKRRIHQCNTCFRTNPKPVFPKMAPLPQLRIQQAKAFAHTGVDYAGPINITLARRRGSKTQKAYICLFVCLVVKAIHLELVTELTTCAFLNAFKRFLSRRGPCSVMLSDCGTNFIGAKNHIEELNSFLISRDFQAELESELVKRHVDWQFNPPSAPHFGGLWESNVKSVKNHLKRVMGEQILTYEELNTLLVQIEALLNSRPLCVLSNDPTSPTALTPAHFLTLGPTLDYLPAENVPEIPLNRLSRYQLIDSILQSFWKRWNAEYLHTLQSRKRWNSSVEPISEGTVVLIKKENAPPLQWPLGVVEKTFPGKDGIVRVVDVRLKNGILRRPVAKLCPLPTQ